MPLSYELLRELLADERKPAAFVDLDAFDRNVDRVVEMVKPHGIPVRPASKSVRVASLLDRLLAHPSGLLRGLMCYCCEEAEFLAGKGIDDLLVAYPAYQQSDIERVARLTAAGTSVYLMSDSRESLENLSRIGQELDVELKVVLCVDMSLKLAGGRLHLGVRRSPLHSPKQVADLAEHAAGLPKLRFYGLMGYEAQVAGLGDQNPFEPRMNTFKTLLRKVSAAELKRRRAEMVHELERRGLSPTLVNGGGSGSLDTTTPETGVTEVTAGSAFFKSHLFDYYKSPHMQALEPACFYALEVTRTPGPGMVTCLGGGYVASGPTTTDKAPVPYLPRGIKLIPTEMAGEVQTPFELPEFLTLELGDPVILRHAKAGELAERFREYLLISGGEIVDRVPTYRGEGQCFL